MNKNLQLFAVIVFAGVLVTSVPIQSGFSDSGFTNVKKATGVIMKFCENHATTLQDCVEKYDGYTWTDRVNVLIWAPGWNNDSDKLDRIGESEGTPITVTSRADTVDTAVFTETGPDTGVFFGVVKLTGQNFVVHDQNGSEVSGHGHTSSNFGTIVTADCNDPNAVTHGHGGGHGHGFLIPLIKLHSFLFSAIMTDMFPSAYAQMHGHMRHTPDCSNQGVIGSALDVAVRVPTDLQNGAVTVSWEPNEDTVITKTATWEWRTGELYFEREMYTVDQPIRFTLHDADLWIHHADFYTYWMRVYSDSDQAGIFVPVQFQPNHDHGAEPEYKGVTTKLTEPAASSLTKYTPDGEYKIYFWWQPGGVVGVDQDYDLNIMVHDGMTDIHQTHLSYDMEIYLNGELIDVRNDRFSGDGQGIETVNFAERGSAKVVIKNIFGNDVEQDFSFQVAPEAIIEEIVPRHNAFDTPVDEYEGRYGAHYINVLEGEFYVTLDDSSQELDELRVNDGDTITVEYIDLTLPEPHTSADSFDIQATTVVYDVNNPLAEVAAVNTSSSITDISADSKSYEGIKKIQATKSNTVSITPVSSEISIPTWVKMTASWWSDGQINDPEFAKGIEYLVQENIIDIKKTDELIEEVDDANITSIPMWVRNNASWWSEGQLTDVDFANGIKYLISAGLIKV